jgi:hypothetical protein
MGAKALMAKTAKANTSSDRRTEKVYPSLEPVARTTTFSATPD